MEYCRFRSFLFSLLIVSSFLISALSFAPTAFAIPPLTPYDPAQTLDPGCLPGSANCFVQILPDQTGNAGLVLTTNGATTTWQAASTTGTTSNIYVSDGVLNSNRTVNGGGFSLTLGANLIFSNAASTTATNGFDIASGCYAIAGVCLSTAATSTMPWAITGNAGTVAGTNFIGTTDAVDFVVKTNNVEVARFDAAGNLGINVVPSGTYGLEQSGQTLLQYDVPATTRRQMVVSGDDVTGPAGLGLGVEGTGFLSQDTASPNVIAYMFSSILSAVSLGYQDVTTGVGSQMNLGFGGLGIGYSDGTGNNAAFNGSGSTVSMSSNDAVTGDSNVTAIGNTLTLYAQNFGGVQNSTLTLNDTTLTWDGEATLSAFPSTRDDTATFFPVNFLYTDASGNVLSAPTSTLSGALCPGSTTIFCQNGNSFGALATIGTNDAFDLVFEANNTEIFRIDESAGGVAIGTTTAAAALAISGNVAINDSGALILKDSDSSEGVAFQAPGIVVATYSLTLPDAQGALNQTLVNDGTGILSWATSSAFSWNLFGNSDATTTSFIGTQNAFALKFFTSNVERMVIGTTTGNVGIGISTPLNALHVASSTGFISGIRLAVTDATVATTTNGKVLTVNGSGDIVLAADGGNNCSPTGTGTVNECQGTGALQSLTTGDNNAAFGDLALSSLLTGNSNTAVGYGAGQSHTGNTNVAIGLSSLSSGSGGDNVAIGVSALANNGAGNQNVAVGRSALALANGSTDNVGLGHSALTALTSATALRNIGLGKSAGGSLTTGSGNIMIGAYVDAPIIAGSSQLNIGNVLFGTGMYDTAALSSTPTATGMIGIGSTTPGNMLAVASSTNFISGIRLAISAATVATTTNGKVLTVNGAGDIVLATDGSGCVPGAGGTVTNECLGNGALQLLTTGTNNSAFGDTAGDALITGIDNAFFGFGAGSISTSTIESTGVGAFALANNSADYSTAFGAYSLFSNTFGQQNVALGDGALFSNTTGGFNTAVGTIALFNNVTGTDNVAMGISALHDNLASNNLAVGSNALAANTTGTPNLAIGRNALNLMLTGNRNLAIGDATLDGATTTSDNLAIGHSALGGVNLSGEFNVAIGNNSGSALTTGNLNVFMGYDSGLTANTGVQNVAIGNNAFRAGTSGSRNVFIGSASGDAMTTGSNNTGVGYGTLSGAGNGSENAAFGYAALLDNTSGERNVGLGFTALTGNTSGSDNVAIGRAALFSSLTATGSIAIGSQALNISTGSGNIAIGLNAGSTITTGEGNLMIGSSTAPTSATANNEMNIANFLFGTGINSLTGRFGIGTSTPGATLSFVGGLLSSSTATSTFQGGGINLTTAAGNTGCYAINGTCLVASGAAFGGPGVIQLSDGNGMLTGTSSFLYATSTNVLTMGPGADSIRIFSTTTQTNSDNFFAGRLAGNFTTTGTFNTGVGARALTSLTSGSLNSAFGVNALTGNNSGGSNSAFGANALAANTSGSSNVAMGLNAMTANLTGSSNVAIGNTALSTNSASSFNTAVGASALVVSTGGINTAIGALALLSNVGGTDNTAVGANALQQNVSGVFNVGMGEESLLRSLGDRNTALGGRAGQDITTGSDNIVIGFAMDVPLSTGSNQLSIGNLIYGTGINGTASTTLSTGNIGIGTTTPGAKLSIVGGFLASTTATSTFQGGGINLITAAGNTGCYAINGTCLQSSGLAQGVIGSIQLNDGSGQLTATSSYAYATSTGILTLGSPSDAIRIFSTTTQNGLSSNFFAGNGAGNILGTLTGTNNTGIGYLTAQSLTTGNFNTALGSAAFQTNTTGSTNVAVGFDALRVNLSGSSNVAVGAQALRANSTGANNIAVGTGVLFANTASNNTGVGFNALNANIGGTLNAAFGTQAVFSNTTGGSNNGFGYQALVFNSTGSDNVAFGESAGAGVAASSNVSRNVFLGAHAGFAVLTGADNNILIGYHAGDALTTGANNLIIGHDIDAPSNTGSNQLSIGNLIFGTGIDGTGTALSTGNIGIGTTTPGAKLSIVGGFLASTTATSTFQGGGINLTTSSGNTGCYAINGTCLASSGLAFGTAGTIQLSNGAGQLTGTSTDFIYSTSTNVFTLGTANDRIRIFATTTNTNSNNLFIGDTAGNFTTTGLGNTGVGALVMGALTSGTSNTALGNQAAVSITSGGTNVALGQQALQFTNTGGANVGVGVSALAGNTSGSNNIGIGSSAVSTATNGSDNIGIGTHALLNLNGSLSSRNVAIGISAGNQLTSGSGNIFIGSYVQATTTTATSTLNIGNVLFGSGMYNTAAFSSSPTANGSIGVGTTSPFSTFAIHANASSTKSVLFAVASTTNLAGVFSSTTLFSIDRTGSTTAANGFNITAGCYAIAGTCLITGGNVIASSSASSTAGTGVAFWADGTNLTASSTFYWTNTGAGALSVATTTTANALNVGGTVFAQRFSNNGAALTGATSTIRAGVELGGGGTTGITVAESTGKVGIGNGLSGMPNNAILTVGTNDQNHYTNFARYTAGTDKAFLISLGRGFAFQNSGASTNSMVTGTSSLGVGLFTDNEFASTTLHVKSPQAMFMITDTAATADLHNWYMQSNAGSLLFGTTTDAGTATSTFVTLGNTGTFGIGTTTPGLAAALGLHGRFFVGTTTATTTATSTISHSLNVQGALQIGTSSIYLQSYGTSTFNSGINVGTVNGCFAINGACSQVFTGVIPFSGLTAATGTNTLDNAALAQTWNWTNGASASDDLTMANLSAGHTGNVLQIASNATAPTNGIARLNFTGDHTGNGLQIDDVTTAGNAMQINANSMTTGRGLAMSVNGITSGVGHRITSSATGMTGSLAEVRLTGNNAANTGILMNLVSTGANNLTNLLNITSSQTGGTAMVINSSLTTGTAEQIAVSSITSGKGLEILSASTAMTGDLQNITLSGSNAANTGNLLNIDSSGASSIAKALKISVASTGNFGSGATAGNGIVNWNFTGAYSGSGFQIDTVNIGARAFTINNTAAYGGAGLQTITANSATTGNLLNLSGTSLTSGNAIIISAGVTTGNGINVSANNITTGYGLSVNSSSASSGAYVANLANTGNTDTSHGLIVVAGSDTGVAGGAKFTDYRTPNGTSIGSVSEVLGGAAVVFNTTSDVRKKHNITDTALGLADLMKIAVKDFVYNSDPNNNIQTGFIAQNLVNAFPNAVTKNGDDGESPLAAGATPWQVDYGRVTPILVKGIQELNTKVDLNNVTVATALASTTVVISNIQVDLSSINLALEEVNNKINIIDTKIASLENNFTNQQVQIDLLSSSTALFWNATSTVEDMASSTIFAKIVGAFKFIPDFFTNRTHTKELCIGDEVTGETCITKAELDNLLGNQATTSKSVEVETDEPEEDAPEPEVEPVVENIVAEEATEEVVVDSEPIVESTEVVEGEAAPTPEPTPEPEIAPEPTPEPAPESVAAETPAI